MTTEEVRALLKAVPFRPFHLWMRDGRCLLIDDPFYAKITPGRNHLVFSPQGGGFLFLKVPEMDRVEMDAAAAA